MYIDSHQGVLGHTRLAIMDLAQGQQPFHNEDRSAMLVANGMIYHYPQLRQRLKTNRVLKSRNPHLVLALRHLR